jgi:hypothetical protein
MVFTVSEKLIKARDGAAYDLAKYILGTDYVVRRAFKGERRMFRKGILDLNGTHKSDHIGEPTEMVAVTVVDPSLVEHKQDKTPVLIKLERPSNLDGSVRSAKVVKKYPNQRYVETDTLGRVFVGEKGNQVKLNQLIQVRDGSLYLSRCT